MIFAIDDIQSMRTHVDWELPMYPLALKSIKVLPESASTTVYFMVPVGP